MNLGKYYLALNVSDIAASKEFYEKLGYTADPNCGGVEQRWMIMTTPGHESVIGLYQGMFPKNTITFNPTDARALHKELEGNGMSFVTAAGIENESGPCHFMLTDPDGNPVLVDQHF